MPDPLVAHGGYSAPQQPVYDLFPKVHVNRGSVVYPTKDPKTERYLTMALGVATQSKCRMKHGAVVVRHGKVLGAATNVTKNSPLYVNWKHSAIHAEMAAMKKAGWPKKASIYVARSNNFGEARMSKPCANCQAVLDEFKCKVYWTE